MSKSFTHKLLGWNLVSLALTTISACLVFVLVTNGWNEDGLRAAIRVTARGSFLFFVAAFSASSLALFVVSPLTRWQLANRRFLGISFALCHLLHAGAILALAAHTEGATLAGRAHDVIGGSVIYGLILFMLVTSFDRPAAWVGPRLWKRVHTLGGYVIFVTFLSSYGGRALESLVYLPQVLLLLSVLALRIARRLRRS